MEGDQDCLDLTIEIDDFLEGHEEFYVTVNGSLSTPQDIEYGESFFVIIEDDGKYPAALFAVISYANDLAELFCEAPLPLPIYITSISTKYICQDW